MFLWFHGYWKICECACWVITLGRFQFSFKWTVIKRWSSNFLQIAEVWTKRVYYKVRNCRIKFLLRINYYNPHSLPIFLYISIYCRYCIYSSINSLWTYLIFQFQEEDKFIKKELLRKFWFNSDGVVLHIASIYRKRLSGSIKDVEGLRYISNAKPIIFEHFFCRFGYYSTALVINPHMRFWIFLSLSVYRGKHSVAWCSITSVWNLINLFTNKTSDCFRNDSIGALAPFALTDLANEAAPLKRRNFNFSRMLH